MSQRGPINLSVDLPPTRSECGIRFNVRLTAKRADKVRAVACKMDMDALTFISAYLRNELPRLRSSGNRQQVEPLKFVCTDPSLLPRVERLARYYGYASAEEYLTQNLYRDIECAELDLVVHPQSEQPVGDDAMWNELATLIDIDTREYVADPLDQPGYLDRFPSRNPMLHFEMLNDSRLEPARAQ